jgi:2-dehydro-3-deoxyphosphogluconate aldolase / (4S)-4-hydroxy-2-oxoglutarate aldolase
VTDAFERIGAAGVLPVVELPGGADPVALVDALAAGGIDVVEITLRTAGALAAIRLIRRERPHTLVAAGTVLDADQADAAIDAGAQLVVSPGFSAAVVSRAATRGTPVLPGAVTPTEVELGRGEALGAFKFFPAEAAGGVPFLAALAGPYPAIRFVPTGGIDASNLATYLALPNVLACGGSWLASRSLLAAGQFETVARLAVEASAIVRSSRPPRPPK